VTPSTAIPGCSAARKSASLTRRDGCSEGAGRFRKPVNFGAMLAAVAAYCPDE